MDALAELTSGDHRRALTALRDILAGHLLLAEPSVSAQIAARLQAVLTDLAALPAEAGSQSKTDELRARRAARHSA